jgi:SulP family sulfate permease
VRIELTMEHQRTHHLATFGRGDFFGEMAFLDRAPRSADAVASAETDLFVISRERFDPFAIGRKRVGMTLFQGLARSLAVRLRYTDAELRALHE